MPPLNFNSTASSNAKSGDIFNSGVGGAFNVNYGNDSAMGGGLPKNTLMVGALLVAGYLLWRKKST